MNKQHAQQMNKTTQIPMWKAAELLEGQTSNGIENFLLKSAVSAEKKLQHKNPDWAKRFKEL